MPQYELMYIVASSISDDQIPSVTEGVLKFITDLGGKVLRQEEMGKKKLAYPIKKTRNGFYALVEFEAEPSKIAELDTKVRTAEGIIRHIIVNMEEAKVRMAKDIAAQEKMNKNRSERAKSTGNEAYLAESEKAEGEKPAEKAAVTAENLDEKIEEALSEDLANV